MKQQQTTKNHHHLFKDEDVFVVITLFFFCCYQSLAIKDGEYCAGRTDCDGGDDDEDKINRPTSESTPVFLLSFLYSYK